MQALYDHIKALEHFHDLESIRLAQIKLFQKSANEAAKRDVLRGLAFDMLSDNSELVERTEAIKRDAARLARRID